MESKPLVSIVVPVYNVEEFLVKCIDSILSQTYKNIEVILVNDGSLDKGGEICDRYAKQDSRLKVIHQKNKGLSGARNTGLKYATGEYIGFVDSDDWIEPDKYAILIDLLQKNNLEIIECGIAKTNGADSDLNWNFNDYDLKIETYKEAINRIISNNHYSVWRRVYKSHLVKDYLFKEGKTSEDVYFTIDNLPKVPKIGVYLAPLYNYRYNPDSITKSAYSLKKFDSLDAGFYLLDKIKSDNPSEEIVTTAYEHMLKKLLKHYKLLNYNPRVDPDFYHRKKILGQIKELYPHAKKHLPHLNLARQLPMRLFGIFIRLNRFKHNLAGNKVG